MHKNSDVKEIAKFDLIANDWWDPKGKSRPLHDLNPTRLQFIADRVSLADKTVLDIGCGGGILSESMAARGAMVTGLDVAPSVLAVAKLHAAQNNIENIHYVEASAEEFAETHAKHFDVVTCMELLEHVPDPESLIAAASKLVKPQGHLFFSTLNRNPKSYLLAILGAEYILNLLPRGTHEYAKFIRPSELAKWFTKSGIMLQDLAGIQYNPFTHTATLNDDVSVNYLVHARIAPV